MVIGVGQKLFSRTGAFLSIVILAYLSFTLPYLSISPLVWSDEGLLSEVAWFFTKEGTFAQPLREGYLNNGEFTTHPNYLYFLFLSSSFKILGLGIWPARIVSVLAGFLLIIFFYLFTRKVFGNTTAKIATVLLAFNPLFILSARIVRQEMLFTLFAFLAIGATILGVENKKKYFFVIAGICTTLTTLVHLNGLFVALALFILMLFHNEKIKNITPFLSAAFVTALPYLIFVVIHWSIFLEQSAQWTYRVPGESSALIKNFFMEPLRWSKGITTPVSLIVGVITALLLLPQIRRLKNICLPLVVILLCFTFVDYHKYYGYLLIILPLFCILSGVFFKQSIKKEKTKIPTYLILFLILFVYVSLMGYKVWRDHKADYGTYCEQIKDTIPNGDIILADTMLWFCFPEGNLRDIIAPVWIQEATGKSFAEIFREQKIAYIILDPWMQDNLKRNRSVVSVPEDYLVIINQCTVIKNITNKYYPTGAGGQPVFIYLCKE